MNGQVLEEKETHLDLGLISKDGPHIIWKNVALYRKHLQIR